MGQQVHEKEMQTEATMRWYLVPAREDKCLQEWLMHCYWRWKLGLALQEMTEASPGNRSKNDN